MGILLGLISLLSRANAAVLALGRGIGVACVAVMVVFILIQVFFRYVLGNALPWSEEGARFLMLWMMGLMAPTAFRRGGFVSIDMVVLMLPTRIAAIISLALLGLCMVVLITGLQIGYTQVTGFAGRFTTDALWLPANFALTEWFKVPRAWAMASLPVGLALMLSVNVELILRSLATFFGAETRLPLIDGGQTLRAE
ncbi:TRAP transporter small permease [Roseicitreum antarcticum]|uniref:TRAP transporter small permease protein n=1 Tax=Roseicitreum antarcticum TaxID=564137 RepID=A0A1H2Z7G9_9RHOB|nr:TRAP transporter small permease subunit [Roseicitreum antarcticum]SDX13443.1 TRAP-type C4-dicarboxylate transport system, small permease component [Roseicitreum antarcticum]